MGTIKRDDNRKTNKYNPKFVAMVKKAQKSIKRTIVDPNNIWESIK